MDFNDSSNNLHLEGSNNYGLYHGMTGDAIISFLSSQTSLLQKEFHYQNAIELLNAVSECVGNLRSTDFENGLAGIGWAVEWIAQNNILQIDTDEVLEDIDDAIYKSVVYFSENDISLRSGDLGKLVYFFYRHKSKNKGYCRFKNIAIEECLVLVIGNLFEKICGDNGLIYKEILNNDDLINIGHLIFFISDIELSETPAAEKILYEIIYFLDAYLEKNSNVPMLSSHNIDSLIFVSICYFLCGKNHVQNYWIKRAQFFIQRCENSFLFISPENTFLKALILNDVQLLDKIIMDFEKEPITLTNRSGKLFLHQLFNQNNTIDVKSIITLLLLC